MRIELSEEKGAGSAWLCGACDDVHLRWGRLTLSLPREEFEALARMTKAASERLAEAPGRAERPEPGRGRWVH